MRPERPEDDLDDNKPETRKQPGNDKLEEDRAASQSPPGTASGRNTTRAEADDQEPSPEHRDTGERARRDQESELENTDRYDTSGQAEAPPKTPYSR